MTYPVVLPYVTGTAFTDSSGGRSAGDWQKNIMTPVTGAQTTTDQNKLGIVDNEGRVESYHSLAARTATPTTYTVYSRGAIGLTILMTVTAITATPSVVMTVDGYNATAGTWSNILTSAAVATVSTNRYQINPFVAAVANVSVNAVIPDTIRIAFTHGDADSITYAVDLDWMDPV